MKFIVILLGLGLVLSGCKDNSVYTLYRSSILIPNARIHVATFNSADSDPYNEENCNLAKTLFQSQPKILTTFWCEKGTYQP